jgi:hypothetical protein
MLSFQEQVKAQCGAEEFTPSTSCENAPFFCIQNLCYTTTTITNNGNNGFCGPNTAIHNPQYFMIIPTNENISIYIHVDNCSGGNGLQSAILQACPWINADVLDCDPGTPPGGTMVLEASGLTIGIPVWLVIDGSAGATCVYTITFTEGIESPGISGEITAITGAPAVVTQGDQISLDLTTTVTGAHGYYWVTGWNQDTITSTLPSIFFNIPCDIDPGLYSICARAFSGCDTTDNEVCIVLEILELQDAIKEPSAFCLEAFPFTWGNEIIEGPGLYTQEFQSSSGCPHDSVWQINAYPASAAGLIDTLVCAFQFIYEGESYDVSGQYLLHYPGQNINGCDSIAELHLTLDGIAFFIESLCADSSLLLAPAITAHSTFSDSVYYAWYDCETDSLLSTNIDLLADTSGCYRLVLDHGFCHDTLTSSYQTEVCEMPCSLVQETGCIEEGLIFTFDGVLPDDATLHWLIDQPGLPATYFGGTDSIFLSYPDAGCYRASLTIVDSINTYTCVDSFCIETPSSMASICCSETGCGDCRDLVIEITGIAPWTIYITGPEGTDTIADINTSPYVHSVCPPKDSLVVYTFSVTDEVNDCLALMPGGNTVSIQLNSSPVATVAQEVDTLCANDIENATYKWLECEHAQVLSTSRCFEPDSSGCYCVEITNQKGCPDTACYEFIISSTTWIENHDIKITPVPSRGTWSVQFPQAVIVPVEWFLFNLDGQQLEGGIMPGAIGTISLSKVPSSGIYFLKFTTSDGKSLSAKVIIQSD